MERIGRRINRWFEAMGDPRQMSAESYGINQASLPLAPTLTRAVFADRSYQQSFNWLTTSGLTGAFWLTSQSPLFNDLYLANGKNVRSGFLRDYLSGTRLSSVPFERAIQFNQFLHPEV